VLGLQSLLPTKNLVLVQPGHQENVNLLKSA
jgi:hypothetical protein